MTKTYIARSGKVAVLAFVVFALIASLFTMPVFAEVADDDSTEANVSFKSGALTLEKVPQLQFGDHSVPAELAQYPAINENIVPVEVSDLRGTNVGWTVNVALSPFRLSTGTPEEGPYTLAGASVEVTNADVQPVNNTVGTKPQAPQPITIQSDSQEVRVLTANNGTGSGVWESIWTPGSTVLTVLPGTAQIGNHMADMVWTLVNAP